MKSVVDFRHQVFLFLANFDLCGDWVVEDVICYCFGYSTQDIEDDYNENGSSALMLKIQREKASGNCECAIKNPKGR